jgi:hypothetical protein
LAEPAVHFLTESTKPEAQKGRERINAWYANFPDTEGKLRRTITSRIDRVHYAGLDEVFIHQKLLETGLDVHYEVGGAGPDFRCCRGGQFILAVEVASLFMKEDWDKEEKAFGKLADYVNGRARPKGFFVHLDIVKMTRTPSSQGLSAFIDRWIDALPDPATVTDQYESGIPLPFTQYVASGVQIQMEALPIRQGAPSWTDPDFRLVSGGNAIGGIVDSAVRLRSVLDAKRPRRYKLHPSACYVVAVANHDITCSIDQALSAMYGVDQRALEELNSLADWERKYAQEAFFGYNLSDGSRRNTRVSAVCLFELTPWSDPPGSFRYFDPPAARSTVPREFLPPGPWFQRTSQGWVWSDSAA